MILWSIWESTTSLCMDYICFKNWKAALLKSWKYLLDILGNTRKTSYLFSVRLEEIRLYSRRFIWKNHLSAVFFSALLAHSSLTEQLLRKPLVRRFYQLFVWPCFWNHFVLPFKIDILVYAWQKASLEYVSFPLLKICVEEIQTYHLLISIYFLKDGTLMGEFLVSLKLAIITKAQKVTFCFLIIRNLLIRITGLI